MFVTIICQDSVAVCRRGVGRGQRSPAKTQHSRDSRKIPLSDIRGFCIVRTENKNKIYIQDFQVQFSGFLLGGSVCLSHHWNNTWKRLASTPDLRSYLCLFNQFSRQKLPPLQRRALLLRLNSPDRHMAVSNNSNPTQAGGDHIRPSQVLRIIYPERHNGDTWT